VVLAGKNRQTSRHFAAKQRFGRFLREADINRQARPVSTVANDP
jgi:hypothetical protein